MTYHDSNIDDLNPLQEVHFLILDWLEALVPTKMLRLNKQFYDQIIPRVYETVSLDEENTEVVLYGLVSQKQGQAEGKEEFRISERKETALRQVKILYLADWKGSLKLHEQWRRYVQCLNDDEDNPESRSSSTLFENVKHLHLGSELIFRLSRVRYSPRFAGIDRDSYAGSIASNYYQNLLDLLSQGFNPETIVLSLRPPWPTPIPQGENLCDTMIETVINNFIEVTYVAKITKKVVLDIRLDLYKQSHALPDLTSFDGLDKTTCSFVIKISTYGPPRRYFIANSRVNQLKDQVHRIAGKIYSHYLSFCSSPEKILAVQQYQIYGYNLEAVIDQLHLNHADRIPWLEEIGVNSVPNIDDMVQPYQEDSCYCEEKQERVNEQRMSAVPNSKLVNQAFRSQMLNL